MGDYPDVAKARIVKDILIFGCSSEKAKDKIIREHEDPNLDRIIEILQVEDLTKHSIKNLISNGEPSTAQVHYARYDSKSKSRAKAKNSNSTSSDSNSTEDKKCYRCGKPFSPRHMKNCKAKGAECNFCGIIGHFESCCNKKKKVNSTKMDTSPKKVHTLTLAEDKFYDQDGNLRNIHDEGAEN